MREKEGKSNGKTMSERDSSRIWEGERVELREREKKKGGVEDEKRWKTSMKKNLGRGMG